MARKPGFRYAGLASDPIFRVAPRPDSGFVKPLPKGYVSNPGGYVTLQADGNNGTPATAPGIIVGWNNEVPDEITIFSDPVHQYNCFDLEAHYPQTARGWVVPDLIICKLNYNSQATSQPVVSEPFPFFGSRNVTTIGPIVIDFDMLKNVDFRYQPQKLGVAPVLGDPTNSSQVYDSTVFRVRGSVLFNKLFIASWGTFNGGTHNISPTGCLPYYTLRAWFDQAEQAVRVGG